MANGSTIDIDNIIVKDDIACELSRLYVDWEVRRAPWVREKAEIQRYVFAIDTTTTSNAALPWKNTTHVPKLCQIRDNLFANYTAALFPKSDWLEYIGSDRSEQTKTKVDTIKAYMQLLIERPEFKAEVSKMLYDFIDYGNVIAGVEWIDETRTVPAKNTQKTGFVGPVPKRYSPVDVLFNPIAPAFNRTGKFIRSQMTMGDFATQLAQETPADDQETSQKLLQYMRDLRIQTGRTAGSYNIKNEILNVSGFTDFISYLQSNYVEVLTFYGDYYDIVSGVLHQNKIITIVDRHKLVSIVDNPSMLGTDGLHHCGWRIRQDSLYAMGPLDNLVGMQYRIDHLENLKADCFDLIAFPPLMIKGLVDDFKWGPMERIHVGEDGDVKVLAPDVNALQANLEIQNLMNLMEEMAGSPKEAAGFRTPGEKTMYEVQRLENAAARIFATKILQFSVMLEELLNDMLEMARRKATSQTIRMFDSESSAIIFMDITTDDIAGTGRIRPMAARNFAEKAERVQNINNFFQSTLGQDPDIKAHFSSIKLAEMFEELLDIDQYDIVQPYVRLSEQEQAQRLQNAGTEQTQMAAMSPSGMTPDDMPEDMGLQ